MEWPFASFTSAMRQEFLSQLSALCKGSPNDILEPEFTEGCTIFRAQLWPIHAELICSAFKQYSDHKKAREAGELLTFSFFNNFHVTIIRNESIAPERTDSSAA